MTAQDTIAVLSMLRAVYPNFLKDQHPKEAVKVWQAVLGDLDPEAVNRAAADYCREEHFQPVPADLYRRAVLYAPRALPEHPKEQRDMEQSKAWHTMFKRELCKAGLPTFDEAKTCGMTSREWGRLVEKSGIWDRVYPSAR